MVGEGAAASIDDTHDSPGPLSTRAGLFRFHAADLPNSPLMPMTATYRLHSLPMRACMRMCTGMCTCHRPFAADRE
jgi:hypothetical protein